MPAKANLPKSRLETIRRSFNIVDYNRFSMPGRFLVRHAICWMALLPLAAAADNGCPDRPVQSISLPAVPADVCIPDGFIDVPILYFDDYSWRAFLAMVWPAARGHRGVADVDKSVDAA